MDFSLLLAIEENPYYKKHAETTRKLTQLKNLQPPSLEKNKSAITKNNDFLEQQLENEDPHANFKNDRHAYLSSNLQYIYHISIIDYLQYYNFDKKMENFVKTIWRGRGAEISAVPPKRYAKRYIEFMDSQVILADKKKMPLSSVESDNSPLHDIKEEDVKDEEIEW